MSKILNKIGKGLLVILDTLGASILFSFVASLIFLLFKYNDETKVSDLISIWITLSFIIFLSIIAFSIFLSLLYFIKLVLQDFFIKKRDAKELRGLLEEIKEKEKKI